MDSSTNPNNNSPTKRLRAVKYRVTCEPLQAEWWCAKGEACTGKCDEKNIPHAGCGEGAQGDDEMVEFYEGGSNEVHELGLTP